MSVFSNLNIVSSTCHLKEWLIISMVTAVVISFTNTKFFLRLFKVEANKQKQMIVVFFGALMRFFSVVFIPAPFHRLLNIVTMILIYIFVFKQRKEICILGGVVNALFIISIEAVSSKFCAIPFNNINGYTDGVFHYKYKFLSTFIITIIRAIIYYFIVKKDISVSFSEVLSSNNRNRLMFVSIVGIALIFFNSIQMTIYITNFPYSLFVLDIFSLIIYFFVSVNNVAKISKLEEKDMKINNLESYNMTLSNMYDSIRGFKHDFANYVQSLNGYVQINDIEGIKNMTKAIFDDCKSVCNLEILDPNIINNAAIYSTLTNKYYLARDNDIQIEMEVMVNFEGLKKNSYEICRILGILLDNAIEAAKQCDEKFISVRFIQEINRKVIIIENSYNHVDLDMDKLFDKGYTTKTDTKNEHGLGLWTVRNILRKSKNLNLFTNKGNLFSQQLEIY